MCLSFRMFRMLAEVFTCAPNTARRSCVDCPATHITFGVERALERDGRRVHAEQSQPAQQCIVCCSTRAPRRFQLVHDHDDDDDVWTTRGAVATDSDSVYARPFNVPDVFCVVPRVSWCAPATLYPPNGIESVQASTRVSVLANRRANGNGVNQLFALPVKKSRLCQRGVWNSHHSGIIIINIIIIDDINIFSTIGASVLEPPERWCRVFSANCKPTESHLHNKCTKTSRYILSARKPRICGLRLERTTRFGSRLKQSSTHKTHPPTNHPTRTSIALNTKTYT